jgi:hypothetical protein
MKLTTRLSLVQKLRMNGVLPLLPVYAFVGNLISIIISFVPTFV